MVHEQSRRGRAHAWKAWLGAMVLCTGCYQGLDAGADGASASDSAGDDGAADDGGRAPPPETLCAHPDAGLTPLRRLTRRQYDNTVRDLLGIDLGVAQDFVSDEKVGTFDSNAIAPVPELGVDQYMDAAEIIAAEAVADSGALLPCDPTVIGEDECARELIAELGPRAYRRPLSQEQLDDAFALFVQGRDQGAFEEGIRLVVQGLLQSPFFLYHLEEIDPATAGSFVALDGYETASRLSYFLWASMPDHELFEAAAAGELETIEAVRAQAQRMLADPKASDTIRHFHAQILAIEHLADVEKDETMFPEFSALLADSMRQEAERFAEHVIFEDDARLETLLTAAFTVADTELADLYEVSYDAPWEGFERVDLDPTRRAGLLSLSGVMAAHSHSNQTSPVFRGKLVRENFLCQPPAPPPDNVNDNPPALDPTLPTKERYEQHRADPVCAGCHVMLDPLGFGFEHYDPIGRYRTMDGEVPVDASGEIVGTTDIDGEYDGPIELMQRLASSEQTRQCITKQWFRYALGRIETEADTCAVDTIYADFEASGFDIRELMVSIAVSDALRHIKVEG